MTDQLFHWCSLANGNLRTCGYIDARGAKGGGTVERDGACWEIPYVGRGIPADRVHAQARHLKALQPSPRGAGIA